MNRVELFLNFELRAQHSLSVREEPHEHVWKLRFTFSGSPIETGPKRGMILDLVETRRRIDSWLSALQGVYLNESSDLGDAARSAPTCEALAQSAFDWVHEYCERELAVNNPTVEIESVSVAVTEPTGFEWGGARVSRSESVGHPGLRHARTPASIVIKHSH